MALDSTADNDSTPTLEALQYRGEFIDRHIGPDAEQIDQMLAVLRLDSLDHLIARTVPESIVLKSPLALAGPQTEDAALSRLKAMAGEITLNQSYIGLGYYDTHTPNVILRNVLENPSWYTAYTPYQPEISQGRLECLLNFQQMTLDLTAMDLANASLLDEATAAAEAMALARRASNNRSASTFFVDHYCFPQPIDVLKTRSECFGFELLIGDINSLLATDVVENLFGAIFQYPSMLGEVTDLTPLIDRLHQHQAIAVVAADIMSLTLLKPPGEMGADVVMGSSQRFGVPMGYGGPHAAYFATRDAYKRAVPGRIIGVSIDTRGKQAFRMALQTREQHIRREKANSNICTAQVLLANMAALYAMYHGPVGLRKIGRRIHRLTSILAAGLQRCGIKLVNESYFDTLTLDVDVDQAAAIQTRAAAAGINLRLDRLDSDGQIGISLDECTNTENLVQLWQVVIGKASEELSVKDFDTQIASGTRAPAIPDALLLSSH